MQEITKAEMVQFWLEGKLIDVVVVKDTVYAKTSADLHNLGFDFIVWCTV